MFIGNTNSLRSDSYAFDSPIVGPGWSLPVHGAPYDAPNEREEAKRGRLIGRYEYDAQEDGEHLREKRGGPL